MIYDMNLETIKKRANFSTSWKNIESWICFLGTECASYPHSNVFPRSGEMKYKFV